MFDMQHISDGNGGRAIPTPDVARAIKNIGTIAGIIVAVVAGGGGVGVYKYQQTAKEAIQAARESGAERQRLTELEQKVEFLERGTVDSIENRLDQIAATQAAILAKLEILLEER